MFIINVFIEATQPEPTATAAQSNNTRKARHSLIDCCFEFQVYKCFITLSRPNKTAGDCQTYFNQERKQLQVTFIEQEKSTGLHSKVSSREQIF